MTRSPVLRVGRIPYANLFPIYRALETRCDMTGIRFVPGSPAALNRKLRAGRLDISPASSIEFAKHPERYLLCPDASVACRTRVMSIFLLSHEPPRRLPDGPIAVTTASDTSVVLLEILLREFLGKRNRLVRTAAPPAEALRSFPAFLAIGDVAIRAYLEGTARHSTDLGAWWRRETGLPFVFALWIVSRASLARREEPIRRFARNLLAAKKVARESVRRPFPDGSGMGWIPESFRAAYYRNLSWDLDREVDGLRLFYRLARKIGRIPAAPPLAFL